MLTSQDRATENLNNATYSDTFWQIRWNQQAAAAFNTTDIDRFSQTAMVTPAISGLRNVDALQVWPLHCFLTLLLVHQYMSDVHLTPSHTHTHTNRRIRPHCGCWFIF